MRKALAAILRPEGDGDARLETQPPVLQRENAALQAQSGSAVERDPNDVFALISLSALHGQRGDFKAIIDLLSPHEAKMTRDVRLAHNYFEALFRSREMEKVTKLLNALAGSNNRQPVVRPRIPPTPVTGPSVRFASGREGGLR